MRSTEQQFPDLVDNHAEQFQHDHKPKECPKPVAQTGDRQYTTWEPSMDGSNLE